jgi:hypothetical protein
MACAGGANPEKPAESVTPDKDSRQQPARASRIDADERSGGGHVAAIGPAPGATASNL